MSLYLKQQDTRSQLQERLAKELQERAKTKANPETPDGVDDSQFIKGTKQTSSLAWVWVVIALFAIGLVVWIILASLG